MAGHRFIEGSLLLSIGPFDRAIAATILIITSKHTVLIIDNRSHQITFLIRIYHPCFSITARASEASSSQITGKPLPAPSPHPALPGTGITFNATSALAGTQIAKKLLPEIHQGHYYITYLYHFKPYVRQKGGVLLRPPNYRNLNYLIKTFPSISAGAARPIILRIVGATSARRPFSTFAVLFSVT